VDWVSRFLLAVAAAALVSFPAWAQSSENPTLGRGPTPDWVVPGQAAELSAASPDTGLRIPLFEVQVSAEEDVVYRYQRLQSQALSPQALPLLGTVAVAWSPASDVATIHQVNLIRDGEVIDLLSTQSFEVLRREENLEQAMLDGLVTAVLQPQGLRVGDILDVAYTVATRDPVVGGHLEQALDLNPLARIERARLRASWPADRVVRTRASGDWTPLRIRRQGSRSILDLEFGPLDPILVPADAPARFGDVRAVEITAYRTWSDIAATLKPLYDRARRIEPGSPLHAEVERIRGLSDDPATRAAAALRLVQDQVRYVALLMGEGALTPATADETWARRFGDCKAKTALLLALLDALGISAEPAAVSLTGGDGLSERLPMIGAFNHVLVRADVGGSIAWLDGTRSGDRALADIRVPPFHWALPLTGPEAGLEPLIVPPLDRPDSELIVDVDASAGLYAPAVLSGTMILRGETATVLGGQLGLIAVEQKDQGLRALWAEQVADPTIDSVASAYDVEANVLTLTMQGRMALRWTDDGLIPPAATYGAITSQERPDGPYRDLPFAVIHPTFARQLSTVRLPRGGDGFRISGGEIDRSEFGHHIRRTVALEGDRVTIETSLRSLVGEITAASAERDRAAAEARPYNPPRVFRPEAYRPTEADRSAWTAETPTTVSGWLDRARALSQSGDPAAAAEAAGEAIALDANSSAAWANRGVYRFWSGDRTGAAEDLARAVDIDPSERIAMNGNALVAMSENRLDDAIIELSRALRQVPNDEFALNLRSELYLAQNQTDRALRDIDALIASQPSNLRLKMRRIGALNQAGRTAEADAEMEALVQASPDNPTVRVNLAAMKVMRGDHVGAIQLIDDLLDPLPANPEELLFLRAESRIALGDLDGAAADLATVRERHPADAAYLNNLCWAAAQAGALLEQALRDCDAALALAPDDPGMIDSRGRVLLQLGRTEDALAAYEAALAIEPDLAASLYGRGLARIALGAVADGEADKVAALAKDPQVADAFESHERLTAEPAP
jgi:tetratricopeptide (TPR) repeat protein